MDPADFTLLIHHHNVAYQAGSGEIWLPAGIARWVSALAVHFKAIGLLLHESDAHTSRQDTPIPEPNVRLSSLGPPGRYWDRLGRMQRIRRACQAAGASADGLLVRGLTPRQAAVWDHTPVANKAFLLVRSPRQQRITHLNPAALFSAAINSYREREFGRIARQEALLIVNSPTYLAEIEQLYGRQAHFISTNILRQAEFAPLRVRPLGDPYRLLYVGRLHFLKGLRELFEAISLLQAQGLPCVLDIVGAPEEPVATRLQELAQRLAIADQLRWRGFVPFGPELFECYQSADIFLLPSYTEGFPRVIWEAAANSCPVITTRVGGIPAILEHERHALLVPPKDGAALAAAVQRLVADEALRGQIVVGAYQRALEFSVEANAQKLTDILAKAWN